MAALVSVLASMVCRFCDVDKKKLAKAHIMPDSMNHVLRRIFGEDRNTPMIAIEKATGRIKPHPMGVYDKTILCGSCDAGFSTWEQHATNVLFTKHAWADVTYDSSGQPHHYRLLNADYAALKLFVLSMLWKTSVSSLHYCRRVNLTDAANQRLRTMLKAANPGDGGDFAVRICQFYGMDAGVTFESHEEVISGMAHAVMYLPGYKLLIKVDNQKVRLDPVVIRPGTPVLVRLLNFQGSPERRSVEKMVTAT